MPNSADKKIFFGILTINVFVVGQFSMNLSSMLGLTISPKRCRQWLIHSLVSAMQPEALANIFMTVLRLFLRAVVVTLKLTT